MDDATSGKKSASTTAQEAARTPIQEKHATSSIKKSGVIVSQQAFVLLCHDCTTLWPTTGCPHCRVSCRALSVASFTWNPRGAGLKRRRGHVYVSKSRLPIDFPKWMDITCMD